MSQASIVTAKQVGQSQVKARAKGYRQDGWRTCKPRSHIGIRGRRRNDYSSLPLIYQKEYFA